MKNVKYIPWVGSLYGNPTNEFGGLKVLVLGESHYGYESSDTKFKTINVVEKKAKKKKKAFFTNIVKVLFKIGRRGGIDLVLRERAWDHIAFYNFIQVLVSKKARVRPTHEMWESAKLPLLQVLDKLKPDIILVLGMELAKNLPEIPSQYKLCKIRHPSGGFSCQKWVGVFKDVLDEFG